MLEKIIIIMHVLTALSVIGLILLQQGKGADAGASFGSGSSQTVFGAEGGGNALTQGTSILAALFFATSMGLALYSKNINEQAGQVDLLSPEVIEQQAASVDEMPAAPELPAANDVPVIQEAVAPAPAAADNDVPAVEAPQVSNDVPGAE